MIRKAKFYVVGAIVIAGLTFLGQQAANAAITGTVCNACHTMHNSQGGAAMTSNADVGTAAQDYLLMFSCLGCHTQEGNGASALTAANAPAAHHTQDPTGGGTYLAGGSFFYVEDAGFGDNYGHNVAGLANFADADLADAPGDSENDGMPAGNQLDCIDGTGLTGCHVGGAHHSNKGNSGEDGAGVVVWVDGDAGDNGASYRFLTGNIKGGEVGDWEYASTGPQRHNVYFSAPTHLGGVAGTITSVCTSCHGDFHGITEGGGGLGGVQGSGAANASPWVRHPTDLQLIGAAAAEHASYGSYSVVTPIGTHVDANATEDTLTMTNYNQLTDGTLETVICQSCHRAHGSPYLDMLRWSYSDMEAGTTGAAAGTGCFKCHTQKDGN